MERWLKTGSVRAESRQPLTTALSKEENNSCKSNNSLDRIQNMPRLVLIYSLM